MKDSDLRGLILKKYYEKRREQWTQWADTDFKDLPESVEFDAVDLNRACDQLADHGLIEWKPIRDHHGRTVGGAGHINANGTDVIENNVAPPISISFDHSRNISVESSSNVQIGDSNIQDVSVSLKKLVVAIESADATDSEKNEAKSRLSKFLQHPLVTSIAGGLADSLNLGS